MNSRRGSPGFTLVEVLVALLILGIMSALGYGTYRAARISAERTEEALKRSREIEFGMRMLVQDFAQLVPRPVRIQLGQGLLPALKGTGGVGTIGTANGAGSGIGTGSSSTMTFNSNNGYGANLLPNSGSNFGSNANSVPSLVDLTRAGWSNTAGQQRGTVQRVSYGLVEDVLKRSYQTSLDTVSGSKPVVQDLFSGVKAIQFRYLDANQSWQNSWPVTSTVAAAGQATLPVAVEVVIEFKDWGRVRRVIEVPG